MELLTNYSNTSRSHSAWKETIHGCASLGFRHAKSSSNMKCTSKSWWPRQNHGHCFFRVLGLIFILLIKHSHSASIMFPCMHIAKKGFVQCM